MCSRCDPVPWCNDDDMSLQHQPQLVLLPLMSWNVVYYLSDVLIENSA